MPDLPVSALMAFGPMGAALILVHGEHRAAGVTELLKDHWTSDACAPSGEVEHCRFSFHSVVLLQRRNNPVAGKAERPDAVGAGHRLRREHRVDDGFFGRVDRRLKERIDPIVGQHRQRRRALRARRAGVRRGKRQKQIAGRIARPTAKPAEPHPDTPGDALELVRQQRRIGRDNHDDRTAAFIVATRRTRSVRNAGWPGTVGSACVHGRDNGCGSTVQVPSR